MNHATASIISSIDSKLRDPSLTGMAVGFLCLWALFSFGTWFNYNTHANLIRNELSHEADLAIHTKALEVNSLLTTTFQSLRTIAMLPGIRSSKQANRLTHAEDIVRNGRLSRSDYDLAKHLFGDLVSSVAVSGVYVVHDGFRPEDNEIPLISFDAPVPQQDSAADPKNHEPDAADTPEIDTTEEYQELVRQLAYYRKHFPVAPPNTLDSVTPINSSLFRTSDVRQYASKKHGDLRNVVGFSFSVPIYDQNTRRFKGIVAAVIRANTLEAALIGLPILPVSAAEKTAVRLSENAIHLGETSNFLLEETLSGIRIFDRRNTQWISKPKQAAAAAFEFQMNLNFPGPHSWVLYNYVAKSKLEEKLSSTRSNALVQFALLSFALALVWATLRSMVRQQNEATRRHLALASELGQASEEHAKTRIKLQATLDTITDLFFEVGIDGRYHDIYSRWPDLLSMPAEHYQGKTISETLPGDVAKLWNEALDEANEQGVSTGKQYQLSLPQGNRWFELSVSRKTTQQSEESRFIVLAHDITIRKMAEEGLRKREVFFRLISENVGDYIAVVNLEGKYVYTSPAFDRFVSRTEGLRGSDAFSWVHADDQQAVREAFALTVSSGNNCEMEYRHVDANGNIYPMECHAAVIRNSQGETENVVLVSRDISERKAKDREIESLAFYDSLTNLPNRRLLLDRLRQALARLARSGSNGALMFIDLDNFKGLNDTLGHAIGDILLQQVGARLLLCVRENDTVARLGGDEFVVMLEDLDRDQIEAASKAELIAEKILDALNKPYQLGEYEHTSTPSIGVTLFGKQSEDMDELLKRADLAMYQAKAAGRNAIRFFDADMRARVLAQIALEAEVRDGLGKWEFILHYQAQIGIDGKISGAEALMRWQHPKRGLIYPQDFIPLAEESGLILPLGQSIMESACRQLADWATVPLLAPLSLAVNVSARQFLAANFVGQVLHALEQTGANPQRLKLELTESLFVSNVDEVIAKMTTLRARGVSFSLDDFGTGYSSLSYLKRLPLDQLKIDQSFVRDLLTDANDVAIARTIVGLAESLNLTVIAEGVETEGQRQILAQQGCFAYQGYLFSEPLPVDQFEALVHRNASTLNQAP
ncbi:MAG: EAL domain-containing protein [Rhodocyclaceae bacterium]|nr:EAL domain-containing protein [Rhodocyclaceae bacterium]